MNKPQNALKEDPFQGHTPGPWTIYTSNSYRRIGAATEYQALCEPVVMADGHADLYFRNGGSDGPDAALLVAAPELLAEVIRLRAEVSRLSEAHSIPEGWKLVPVEPTTEMWDQAENAQIYAEANLNAEDPATRKDAFEWPTARIWLAVVAYRAMLANAPEAPK